MITCETCGGKDFEKDAGFMYCSQCHTQTQHYQEEDVQCNTISLKSELRTPKKKVRRKEEKHTLSIEDFWTSWDAYNYVLHGMTMELKQLGLTPDNFDSHVLSLWAFFLSKCEVAFTSLTSEIKPRLGLFHHSRDLKVLYGLNNVLHKGKKKRGKSGSVTSGSMSTSSVYSQRNMKKKMIESYYREYSLSQKSDTLADETIESLGRSSGAETDDSSVQRRRPARSVLASEDYVIYRRLRNSNRKLKTVRKTMRSSGNYFSKGKLLEIIHLALLLSESSIQLSDLLRFVREGRLSFSKVTHFLPGEIKLSKGDAVFLESISDVNMPTHLKQRKIGRDLARFLCLSEFPVPDVGALIDRYCKDLNLPDQISHYSLNIFELLELSNLGVLKSNSRLPNFEALAIATVIFVMKLFFGLDGKTELVLSDLADKINGMSSRADERKLFSFTRWQYHIECRKTVLHDFHYPTEEKLGRNSIGNSMNFIQMVMKECKDDFREERFKTYPQYYIDPKLLNSLKETAEAINEPLACDSVDFPPSLTPNTSYLDAILETYSLKRKNKGNSDSLRCPEIKPAAWDLLNENFRKCGIDFVFDQEAHIDLLVQKGFQILKRWKSELIDMDVIKDDDYKTRTKSKPCAVMKSDIEFPEFSSSKKVVIIENPWDYWFLKRSKSDKNLLFEFKANILDRAPVNFRWLLTECSMMLEMNTREVYNELRFIEKRLRDNFECD